MNRYWDSTVNPNGADAELRRELLEAGPVCFDKNNNLLSCSPNATRTQRAGVYELLYMSREDRAFCSSAFFRSRLTGETRTSSECLEELFARNRSCYISCDRCDSQCTDPSLRAVANTWLCSAGQPVMGIFAASQVSDVGFDITTRHGSDRRRGKPPIPESAWKEQFHTLVANSISHPIVPRASVSCRKAHREDTYGAYTPPLDLQGKPLTRVGFHVPCLTSSDCWSRCGEHPVTGEHYACVKNAHLYSYAGHTDEGGFYTIDEPGDETFDVVNYNTTAEHLGTCMDTNYAYQHTGCDSLSGAGIMYGLVGCAGRVGLARGYCGTTIARVGDDYLHAAVEDSSTNYPRTIVEANILNGAEQPALRCNSALTCSNICHRLNMEARNGGLPPPAACALCEPICPSNLATTVVDTIGALAHDIEQAVRLVATCFGPRGITGCVCNLLMTIKPTWLANLKSEELKCKAGDVFNLLVDKITDIVLKWVENTVNGLINMLNRVICNFKWIGAPCPAIKEVCLTVDYDVYRCRLGPYTAASLEENLGCSYTPETEIAAQCYFAKQRAICIGKDDNSRAKRYQNLFGAPTADDLQQQFFDIVGDSFVNVPPTMQAAFTQLQQISANDVYVEQARGICDDQTDSMTLDESTLNPPCSHLILYCHTCTCLTCPVFPIHSQLYWRASSSTLVSVPPNPAPGSPDTLCRVQSPFVEYHRRRESSAPLSTL